MRCRTEIVSTYRTYKLKEVCSRLRSGKGISARFISKKGLYPVYGGNGLRGYTKESNFQGDCAIIGRQGAFCGNVRYFSGKAYMTEHAVVVVANKENNTRYLSYLLSQMNLGRLSGQSAQPGLSVVTLGELEICLPPLAAQQEISSILSTLDDKIALNRKINANLEAQARAIFQEKIVNQTDLPSSWEKGNLLGIASYLNGLAMQKFRPKSGETGIPVLKIKELRQGLCDNNSDLCSPAVKPEYIISDGDVIFSWSGSLLVDLWCGGICGLNQHLFKVTSSKYEKWFYYLWTVYHLDKFAAIAADKATTMGHIKRDDLEKAEVIIPSNVDLEIIGGLIAPMIDMITARRIENRKLAVLRDTLLPRLMSGEIDVTNIDV